MPPKGASTKLQPLRLPPLHKLRVRRPNQGDANPCLAIMTSVLTCWASAGYNVAGCQALETQLRTCMDTPVSHLEQVLRAQTSGLLKRWADSTGNAETEEPEEEYDQLSLVENVSEYRGAAKEKVTDGLKMGHVFGMLKFYGA